MSHDDAYAFLEIGRGLERADMTTRVLDIQAAILLVGQGDGAAPYADVTWAGGAALAAASAPTAADTAVLARSIAASLGLPDGCCIPGYEIRCTVSWPRARLIDLRAILDASPAATGVGAQSLEYPRTLDLRRAPDCRGHPGRRVPRGHLGPRAS